MWQTVEGVRRVLCIPTLVNQEAVHKRGINEYLTPVVAYRAILYSLFRSKFNVDLKHEFRKFLPDLFNKSFLRQVKTPQPDIWNVETTGVFYDSLPFINLMSRRYYTDDKGKNLYLKKTWRSITLASL